ncbi:MAG: hypothetical protein ACR2PX_20670 [Endozoicomonas sp.]|uniref:hypothetical protein n=1 Tax=Endozoicomonas sp. TaxID=1892382 RepID=UPI003D9B1D6F
MKFILELDERTYGEVNKKELAEYEQEKIDMPFLPPPCLMVYPKKAEDLEHLKTNGNSWLISRISADKEISVISRYFFLPIGNRHMLVISLETSSHGEFYSDKHNVPDECEKTVKTFMENVHVELSDEAKRQKEEVLSRIENS